MKYMRKTPVEAIQWNPDNRTEFGEFMKKSTKDYRYFEYLSGDILLCYWDFNARKHVAKIPKFGWVVREGKAFQFYKDATFKKTFEEVQKSDNKGIDWEGMNKTIKEAFDGFDEVFKDFKDVFGSKPSKKSSGVLSTMVRLNNKGRLAKLIDGLYRDNDNMREEIKKNLSEGLKEMAGSDTHNATFESVLDEMKELHTKKDKDYGSAFHKSFEEFGVTAGVVRLNDKMERVKSLVKNGMAEVKDESLLDTLKDMASYAVMLYVELKNKEK